MNVSIPKVSESRKLTGLLITIGALLLALAVFIVCSALLGTPWDPFRDVLAFITGAGGSHQLSQGASDVSKWRSQPPSEPRIP
jgi:hypothetical protein